MCVPCVLQVSRAFTFKQQCQRSDQSLRALLSDARDLSVSDNNNYKNLTITNDGEHPTNEVMEMATEHETNEQQLTDDNDDDNLGSELALEASLEEEIELSSLPSETQFSPVAAEEIEHLADEVLNDAQIVKGGKNLATKFGDYFDEIKLDVAQVVSLADQALEEQFGKTILLCSLGHFLHFFSEF